MISVKYYSKNLINDYLANPCKFSALPLYKEVKQKNKISVIHDDGFNQTQVQDFTKHQRFFRISHNLENVDIVNVPGYKIMECNIETDIEKVIQIINKSYEDIRITVEDVNLMIKDRVFEPSMWIFVVDENTKKEAALGICHFDESVFEVEFDWIQVLPEYRGKGLGSMLVTYLLNNTPKQAKFATVSGDMDNLSSPEKLYRRCGFDGNDVWYILREENK